ncbi:MAG: PEP-CTERM-box response regulator transcription factor [Pseudomonadota bacterium]|nr:PEP-CTERM-box response regulator transcription factor [Pseudomonadota bacterium]
MILRDKQKKLLIVEDDLGLQNQLRWCFEDYEVLLAENRETALEKLRRFEPPVILQDLGLFPDSEGVSEGFATLEEILRLAPDAKIIVVTGHGDQENALRAVALGAHDFYQKPVEIEILKLIVDRAYYIFSLEQENTRLLRQESQSPLDGIIASSKKMLEVCRMVEKVAPTNATTLLFGESGTGKELLARSLHSMSLRPKKPFVAINCAAIPENLLESELFGHEKGAFTGAVKQTPGRIETADNGTLLLDEIGDMPLALQAKLLRFLQERVIERVGGREEISVDVRVVCATNQDLQIAIKEGRFREDLYYRISEITIQIPPLRERKGGRLILARSLLEKFSSQHNKSFKGFSQSAQNAIQNYDWPGNVRELENKIKGAIILAEGKYVDASDMGLEKVDAISFSLNLRETRRSAESEAIQSALIHASGNISKASKLLGVTRPTLYDLIEKYEIKDP